MAERARTLRQRLSKKAIDKKSTIQEETKEQKENVVIPEVINEVNEDQQIFEPLTVQPLSKTKTVSHFDVDPLNYLEQVDVIEEEKPIDPLEFLENKHTEKKKKIEGEEEGQEGEGKNTETATGEKELKEKKKKPRKSRVAKIRLLLDKIKQKKAENPKKYHLSKVGGGAGRKNAGQIQNHHTPEGFFDRLPEKKNRKKANDGTESKQTDIFAGGKSQYNSVSKSERASRKHTYQMIEKRRGYHESRHYWRRPYRQGTCKKHFHVCS